MGIETVKAIKRIVVATEDQGNTKALYVDDCLITCDETIYASEIAHEADGEPALIIHRLVTLPDGEEFPKSESQLKDHE